MEEGASRGQARLSQPEVSRVLDAVLRSPRRRKNFRKSRPLASHTCHTQTDQVREQRTANLAHLVYLHFYAASALETQVRSMHRGSPHRIGLLDRARDHYRRASVLAEAEGQAAVLLISSRSASPASPYSPTPSLSSSSSGSASTRMSSPTPDSPDGSDTTAHSTPRKGQVEPHCVDIIMDQPQRPDSPTLGPSSRPECSTPEHGGVLATLKLAHQYGHDRVLVDEGESENPLERTRSLHRYADALAALHRQIMTVHLPASQDVAPARPPPSNDDMRAIELRTRIERLRAEGWRRRRFDAARYEALREAALADLMG